MLAALATARLQRLLSGANADDQGDWRPASEPPPSTTSSTRCTTHQGQVRELRATLDLPSAEKPATPCLASRIPYGTAVDPETLS